jgi:nucleoside-diphosphate-sugar epimerase
MKKKIGITGVTGFVGSELSKFLQKRGYDVIEFTHNKKYSSKSKVFWDITKPFDNIVPDIDIVVHCAGIVDDWSSYEVCSPVNVQGTKNVLDISNNTLKFIYISSFSVYDPTMNIQVSIDENYPCGNFLNGYSKSKYEAEQIVLNHTSSCEKIILRPHVIYGKNEKKIIPRLLKADRLSKFIVMGSAEHYISITHIENLCHAIELIINYKSSLNHEIFNISDAKPVLMRKLIQHIKYRYNIKSANLYVPIFILHPITSVLEIVYKIFNIQFPPFVTKYILYQLTKEHILNISKIKNMLNYKPQKQYTDI